MKKTRIVVALAVMFLIAGVVVGFADRRGSGRGSNPPCTIMVAGNDVVIERADGIWFVVCEKQGMHAEGETLCEPLQEVLDALLGQ